MKRIILLLFIILTFGLNIFAQNFNISFIAHGDSQNIDSVIVKNLKTGNVLKLSGSDNLELVPGSGLRNMKNENISVAIFPNPTDNICFIEFALKNAGSTSIIISDITGKVLYTWSGALGKSVHVFKLQGLGTGVYNVNIKSECLLYSGKLVGTGDSNKSLNLIKVDEYPIEEIYFSTNNNLKSAFTLPYSYGDLLLFEAVSDENHKCIKTLILNEVAQNEPNKVLDFYFVNCIDADSNNYKTVEIGDYVWMAEDLKTSKYRDNTFIPEVQESSDWISQRSGAWCYYDNKNSEAKLYNWYAVSNNKKICPQGWHTPSDLEWKKLEISIGLSLTAADTIGWRGNDLSWKLKESGTQFWLNNNEDKTNLSGFSAHAMGIRNFVGNFYYKNNNAAWWTATESNERNAWVRGLQYDNNSLYREDGNKVMGLALRCIKNYPPTVTTKQVYNISFNSANSGGIISDNGGGDIISAGVVWGRYPDVNIDINEGYSSNYSNNYDFNSELINLEDTTKYYVRAYATNDAGTGYGDTISFITLKDPNNNPDKLVDIDGNEYDIISFGTHQIIGQNLKVTKLNDGTSIINETQAMEWEISQNPLYCWYNNDIANKNTYGALYNWYAVNSQKLCPLGWHVLTDDDWKQIEIGLGMNEQDVHQQGPRGTNEGSKLAGHFNLWSDGLLRNNPAFGESGINLVPSGALDSYSGFYGLGEYGDYWALTDFDIYTAWARDLSSTTSESMRVNFNKSSGVAVRCMKDESAPIPPDISTLSIYNITSTSAQCAGLIYNSHGNIITELGVVWSTDSEPNFLNDSGFVAVQYVTDTFFVSITNLSMGVQYYARAYARYSNTIVYGNVLDFFTPIRGEDIYDADGNEYITIKLGNDFWTTQNIKTTHFNDGTPIPLISGEWQAKSDLAMGWYNNDEATYGDIYGALYSWAVIQPNVNGEHNICPVGYHVATVADWNNLIFIWGGANIAGNHLKEFGTAHWEIGNQGTNLSGFTALPGGYRNILGNYSDLGITARYWVADTLLAKAVTMTYLSSEAIISDFEKNYGFSARCVKDQIPVVLPFIGTGSISNITMNSFDVNAIVSSTGGAPILQKGIIWSSVAQPTIESNEGICSQGSGLGQIVCNITNLIPNTNYYVRAFATNHIGTFYYDFPIVRTDFENIGTISDVDGNIYKTVTIGTQNWMRSDLKTQHFADNKIINVVNDESAWTQLAEPAMCWYNNIQSENGLYNWYAVDFLKNGGSSICPTGWRLPTQSDWITLINFLGGVNIAGGKLKKEGFDFWISPNTDADNNSGFTALPNGMRTPSGLYSGLGERANFWSLSQNVDSDIFSIFLTYDQASAQTDWFTKNNAFSVRCIKVNDQESLPTISTLSVNNLTYSSAVINGNLTSDGNISPVVRGFVWSDNPNVSLSQNIGVYTEDGTIGQYSFVLTNLNETTTYFFKAFAINPLGVVYGDEVSFTTPMNTIVYDGDGNAYSVIQIGNQYWLQENLKTITFNNNNPILDFGGNTMQGGDNDPGEPESIDFPAMTWYNNNYSTYGNEYGGLYNLYFSNMRLTKGQNVCPVGFHIPTYDEWRVLIDLAGTDDNALKAVDYWANSNPTDLYGFKALPAGYYDTIFSGFGEQTIWCVSSPDNFETYRGVVMKDDPLIPDVPYFNYYANNVAGNIAVSIRCIKNKEFTSSPSVVIDNVHNIQYDNAICDFHIQSSGGYPVIEVGLIWSTSSTFDLYNCTGYYIQKVTDINAINYSNYLEALNANTTYYVKAVAFNLLGIGYSETLSLTTTNAQGVFDGDGNEYAYVTIGNQKWLKENLKTTKFNDGTNIDNLIDPYMWNNTQNGAYCWYGNDYSTYGQIYGALYNYNAINPLKNSGKYLCPEGWHVPINSEFNALINFVGKDSTDNLRASYDWTSPRTSPDSYGFSALPGGQRDNDVEFMFINERAYFWSSASPVLLLGNAFQLDRDPYMNGFNGIVYQHVQQGLSVRCIRNGNYPILSSVNIEPPVEITPHSVTLRAVSSGNQQDTIFGVGFVISQNPNVNIENAEFILSVDYVQDGIFVLTESALQEQTTYYVKAFAANAIGIAYSSEISFTTLLNNGIVDGSGNVYNEVSISGLIWLNSNLKTNKFNDGTPIQKLEGSSQWNTSKNAAYCAYNNDSATYFQDYGMLYNRFAINYVLSKGKNICPIGYHVPTNYDWNELINTVGNDGTAGGFLKENGTTHWQNPNLISGDYGFNALPGGYRHNSGFDAIGTSGFWWENNFIENDSALLMTREMRNSETSIFNFLGDKYAGYSVRCVKNKLNTSLPSVVINPIGNSSYTKINISVNISNNGGLPLLGMGCLIGMVPNLNFDNAVQCLYAMPNNSVNFSFENLQPSTTYFIRGFAYNENGLTLSNIIQKVTLNVPTPVDADGNTYNCVTIGNQIWMTQNLKTKKFIDGSSIPVVTNNSEWQMLNIPACSYYNNMPVGPEAEYGLLYNSYVVTIQSPGKKVCPTGWRIANLSDWDELEQFLNSDINTFDAAIYLKEQGFMHWNAPNNATNSTGFTALPGGLRNPDGTFSDVRNAGAWWAIVNPFDMGNIIKMNYNSDAIEKVFGIHNNTGASIRCILIAD